MTHMHKQRLQYHGQFGEKGLGNGEYLKEAAMCVAQITHARVYHTNTKRNVETNAISP